MLVTLACIFAGTLFCNNAAHADHHIDAVITIDTQLGTLDTATIDNGASANVSVHITHMDDYPDPTHADGTFTYSWGFFAPPPHVTLPNVNQTSNTLSTNFDTAGEYPITFLCDVDFVPATGEGSWHGEAVKDVTQDVIGGDFTTSGDKTLYYFCGAPVGVGNPQTVSVPSQPPGTKETWSTSAALTVTSDGEIKGVAGSSHAGWDWIQISYSLNGVTWTSPMHSNYTVFKPSTISRLGVMNATQLNPQTLTPDGYYSRITYKLLDQFNDAMPNTNVNESFGNFTSDFAGENWPRPDVFGGPTFADGTFFDNLYIQDPEGIYNPSPQAPGTPLGTTKIFHGSHNYYAGSTTSGQGCLVGTGTLQYYLDHADQEG
jgi:hypothetical protein